jgi:hypothetical protein
MTTEARRSRPGRAVMTTFWRSPTHACRRRRRHRHLFSSGRQLVLSRSKTQSHVGRTLLEIAH